MRLTDYSAPAYFAPGRRAARPPGDQENEKQVDYSHLDIVAEVERITGCSLHHVTKIEYNGRCPFPGCASRKDAFKVWDRPVLGVLSNGIREKHFWCRRCDRRGSLIDLVRQYREATTGEILTWSEAARELRIDPRSWRAIDESAGQGEQRRTLTSERRQREAERRRKAEQAELELLDAAYPLACKILAAGQITRNDLTIPLDLARSYLAARGFTLEQAAALGMGYIPTRQEIGSDQGEQIAAWRGRIIFPLSGPGGARGYAGRSLWKWTPGMTAEQHKALLDAWNDQHPTQQVTRYYKTRQAAYYGYEDATRARTLVCVEGEFDAASVRLALAGVPDIAVCAFGKAFQARLVPLNVLKIVLALDKDQAGQESIARQKDDLEARGVEVEIARPPAGKDWNDCHQIAGLDAIRAAILPALGALGARATHAQASAGIDRCVQCGQPVEDRDGAFYVDDDRASATYGDLFCMPCWRVTSRAMAASDQQGEDARASRARTHIQAIFAGEIRGAPVWPDSYTIRLLPAGMSSAEYIARWQQGERPGQVISPAIQDEQEEIAEQASDRGAFSAARNRCARHGRPIRYSDEQGGRYCDHVACWNRYRLIRAGAARGYPALSAVIDQRDYLPDTSKEPLRYTDAGAPVYPARPVVRQPLIDAGADAWRAYVAGRDYQAIDQAIKALLSEAFGTL